MEDNRGDMDPVVHSAPADRLGAVNVTVAGTEITGVQSQWDLGFEICEVRFCYPAVLWSGGQGIRLPIRVAEVARVIVT